MTFCKHVFIWCDLIWCIFVYRYIKKSNKNLLSKVNVLKICFTSAKKCPVLSILATLWTINISDSYHQKLNTAKKATKKTYSRNLVCKDFSIGWFGSGIIYHVNFVYYDIFSLTDYDDDPLMTLLYTDWQCYKYRPVDSEFCTSPPSVLLPFENRQPLLSSRPPHRIAFKVNRFHIHGLCCQTITLRKCRMQV